MVISSFISYPVKTSIFLKFLLNQLPLNSLQKSSQKRERHKSRPYNTKKKIKMKKCDNNSYEKGRSGKWEWDYAFQHEKNTSVSTEMVK